MGNYDVNKVERATLGLYYQYDNYKYRIANVWNTQAGGPKLEVQLIAINCSQLQFKQQLQQSQQSTAVKWTTGLQILHYVG